MRYVGGTDETGAVIDVSDPLAGRLRALSDRAADTKDKVAALLGVRKVFPEALEAMHEDLTAVYTALLLNKGARKAAEAVAAERVTQ